MTPEFKKQWFRMKAHEVPADAELVSCMPLSLVLEMFGISQINFFSLDVEVIFIDQLVLKKPPMPSRDRPWPCLYRNFRRTSVHAQMLHLQATVLIEIGDVMYKSTYQLGKRQSCWLSLTPIPPLTCTCCRGLSSRC